MIITTAEEFIAALEQSGLLTEQRLALVRDAIERAGAELRVRKLARSLVKRDFLTPWQAEELLAGRTAFYLGKYKLLEHIGQGGMGTVFKAEHGVMNRVVALKVMTKELVDNPTAVVRFRREVQSAAALNHPNIVTAHDADCVGDTHFLVMEYVEGRDLSQWIRDFGQLPVPWSCECIRQAALGLEHAHQRGLMHRDIKPSNLLVSDSGPGGLPRIKILDMGLARFVSETPGEGSVTRNGQIVGTPDYIAPEQADDVRRADIRADIFSLGCTLFHMLTGQLPFSGATVMSRLMARLHDDAPPVADLRADVPGGLSAIVAKMLAREPEHRFQTPAEVAAALAPFAGQAADDPTSALSAPPPIRTPGSSSIIKSGADGDLDDFLHRLAATRADAAAVETPAGGGATLREPIAVARPELVHTERGKVRLSGRAGLFIGAVALVLILAAAAAVKVVRDNAQAALQKQQQATQADGTSGSAAPDELSTDKQNNSLATGSRGGPQKGKRRGTATDQATTSAEESAPEEPNASGDSKAATAGSAAPTDPGVTDAAATGGSATGGAGAADAAETAAPQVLVVGTGEDHLPDLAAAFAQARPGDTILIRHRGPLELDPVDLTGKTPLTIIGDGEGDAAYWPLVRQAPANSRGAKTTDSQPAASPPAALFQADRLNLRLERLHLAAAGPQRGAIEAVFSLGTGRIELNQCTVTVGAESVAGAPVGESLPLVRTTSNPAQKVELSLERTLLRGLRLESCLVAVGAGDVSVSATQTAWAGGAAPWLVARDLAGQLHVALERSTIYNAAGLLAWDAPSPGAAPGPAAAAAVQWSVNQSLFVGPYAGRQPLIAWNLADPNDDLARDAAAGIFVWQGAGNVYHRFPGYFRTGKRNELAELDSWQKVCAQAGPPDRELDPMLRVWPAAGELQEVSARDLQPRFDLHKKASQRLAAEVGADHRELPHALWDVFARPEALADAAGKPRSGRRILRVHQKDGPYTTIEEALEEARDEDIVEIADDGPYTPQRNFDISPGIAVLTSSADHLTIRASDTASPVIVLDDTLQKGAQPESQGNQAGQLFLLGAEGALLHLDGLHFRLRTRPEQIRAIVLAKTKGFRCTNCTFVDLSPGRPSGRNASDSAWFAHVWTATGLCWLENNVFCRRSKPPPDSDAPAPPVHPFVRLQQTAGLVTFRNCLFGDECSVLGTHQGVPGAPLSLHLDHCTVLGQVGIFPVINNSSGVPSAMVCADNLVIAPRAAFTFEQGFGLQPIAVSGSNNGLWGGARAYTPEERDKGINSLLPGPALKVRPQSAGPSNPRDPLRSYRLKRGQPATTLAADGGAVGVRFEYLPELPELPAQFYP